MISRDMLDAPSALGADAFAPSEREIERIRAGVLDLLPRWHQAPEHLGLILIGSIAQGLGNTLSDIDVIAIDFDAVEPSPPRRHHGHIGVQRCEVHFVVPADLDAMVLGFESKPTAYDAWHFSGLYFRIAFGIVLQDVGATRSLVAAFSRQKTTGILIAVHEEGTVTGVNKALAFSSLELHAEAAAAMRGALAHQLKLIVARTAQFAVTGSKYLATQLARSANAEEYGAMLDLWRARLPKDPADYVESGLSLLADSGVLFKRDVLPEISLLPEVEMLNFVGVPALRQGDHLFLINPALKEEAMRLADTAEPSVRITTSYNGRRLARDLYQHGLAAVERLECSWSNQPGGDASRSAAIDIAAEGPRWPAGWAGAVLPLGISLETTVKLCCCILEQVIIYANSQEDVVGAIREQAWPQIEVKLRDMMTAVGVMALANRGVLSPDTSSTGDAAICARLLTMPGLAPLENDFRRLMQLRIDDRHSARCGIELVLEAAGRLPAHVVEAGARCMEDGAMHQRFVVELGSFLSTLARQTGIADTLSVQIDAADGNDDFTTWSRTDDMLREVELLEQIAMHPKA